MQAVSRDTDKYFGDVRAEIIPRPIGFAQEGERLCHLRSAYAQYAFARFLAFRLPVQTEPLVLIRSRP